MSCIGTDSGQKERHIRWTIHRAEEARVSKSLSVFFFSMWCLYFQVFSIHILDERIVERFKKKKRMSDKNSGFLLNS